jgi:hypothetical protein
MPPGPSSVSRRQPEWDSSWLIRSGSPLNGLFILEEDEVGIEARPCGGKLVNLRVPQLLVKVVIAIVPIGRDQGPAPGLGKEAFELVKHPAAQTKILITWTDENRVQEDLARAFVLDDNAADQLIVNDDLEIGVVTEGLAYQAGSL